MRFAPYWVFLLFALSAGGAVVDQEVLIEGHWLEVEISPDEGGAIHRFLLRSMVGNLAGGDGLLQEGFGIGSFYAPNRRLNETLEVLEEFTDRPVIRYSYDCDGPNIRGLHVTRLMEPFPDEASMKVTWTIANKGDERQWVAPWVRNHIAPGGKVNPGDRWDLPTTDGILEPTQSRYYPAARNWAAATDPIEQQSLFLVFHADHTHSFLSLWEEDEAKRGYLTAFVPQMLAPGDAWETVYRVNAVRGLDHIDFACDELAAQLDYKSGKLVLLLSAVKAMPDLEIHARIVAPNGRVWRLPGKRCSIDPNRLARCTYGWVPPAEGAYEFLAQVRRLGKALELGRETGSPHGGIDTEFVVGRRGSPVCAGEDRAAKCVAFEPWTDAPHVLDRGPRERPCILAATGDVDVWFETGLEKIFREDVPKPQGAVDPSVRIALARGERESFQVVLRPKGEFSLTNVRVQVNALEHRSKGARITPEDIALYNVAYHDVHIPSYFEGPAGAWPDALPPLGQIEAPPGVSTPLWCTVHAPPGLPAGEYTGLMELHATGMEPLELWIHVRVYDFDLPAIPSLKTDFGFSMESAARGAQTRGGRSNPSQLASAYLDNALEHRVTLRQLTQFPRESADYAADLGKYAPRVNALLKRGVSSVAVPPSLLDAPEQLRLANDFVTKHHLQNRVFVQLADEPEEPSWPRLLETMQQWKDLAPDIPIMVTAYGLKPFIPDVLDRWAIHSQVFDTPNSRGILQHASEGQEVWWYVNHAPPRPYANFFLDFAAIEHRIFFWQTWALGLRGVHYWGINYSAPGQDPREDSLDITPVNGDGLLVYPGPDGPVNSIRWETIRDGIEDYDYLTIFMERVKQLKERPGQEALLQRALAVYQLGDLVPDLVSFNRTPQALLAKRHALAEMIEEMGRALKR